MNAFSALADTTRLRIVEMIARSGSMPAGEIGRHFSISGPAISQHLKILREAKLVQVEVKAQQRIYRINPHGISEMESWLGKMRQTWEARFDALDELLAAEMEKAETTARKTKK